MNDWYELGVRNQHGDLEVWHGTGSGSGWDVPKIHDCQQAVQLPTEEAARTLAETLTRTTGGRPIEIVWCHVETSRETVGTVVKG